MDVQVFFAYFAASVVWQLPGQGGEGSAQNAVDANQTEEQQNWA